MKHRQTIDVFFDDSIKSPSEPYHPYKPTKGTTYAALLPTKSKATVKSRKQIQQSESHHTTKRIESALMFQTTQKARLHPQSSRSKQKGRTRRMMMQEHRIKFKKPSRLKQQILADRQITFEQMVQRYQLDSIRVHHGQSLTKLIEHAKETYAGLLEAYRNQADKSELDKQSRALANEYKAIEKVTQSLSNQQTLQMTKDQNDSSSQESMERSKESTVGTKEEDPPPQQEDVLSQQLVPTSSDGEEKDHRIITVKKLYRNIYPSSSIHSTCEHPLSHIIDQRTVHANTGHRVVRSYVQHILTDTLASTVHNVLRHNAEEQSKSLKLFKRKSTAATNRNTIGSAVFMGTRLIVGLTRLVQRLKQQTILDSQRTHPQHDLSIKLVLIAIDVEAAPSLLSAIQQLQQTCDELNIPHACALGRAAMGRAILKFNQRIVAIGICDKMVRRVVELIQLVKDEYKLLQDGTEIQTSLKPKQD